MKKHIPHPLQTGDQKGFFPELEQAFMDHTNACPTLPYACICMQPIFICWYTYLVKAK